MKKTIIKSKLFWILIIISLGLFIWLNNTSLLVGNRNKGPTLLAHRGLAQTFSLEGVKWNTNTARIIYPPEHPYIENTIPSMQAAFHHGADIVEFDVRLTKDKKLAVFHDFLLDYRTNATGMVADFTMEELKQLDAGYGYTADNGKTFPFREKGTGMIPVIDEVFESFPDRELLIHIKDGGRESGLLLYHYFREMNKERIEKISLYGDEDAILFLREKYPEMKVLTKSLLIKGILLYELIGWTGYIPESIRNLEIHMPLNYAQFLWGWPDRFLKRMEKANTRFVLVNGTGGFSSGFDTKEDLARLPVHYSGCIWTNRIDIIAPCFRKE